MHLNWRKRCKIIHFPWDWQHVRHSVRRPDGSWVPAVHSWEVTPFTMKDGSPAAEPKEPDGRAVEVHPYRYILRDGAMQVRTATVTVGEREWRWRWFTWLRWPRMVHRFIDVEFNDEVGERTGSWKGGTTGCGYDMRPGETALDTLRRMERERRFT